MQQEASAVVTTKKPEGRISITDRIAKQKKIQDIKELTDYVRHDEDWQELRDILIKKELILDELLLVSFIEDEEMNEYGVVVTIHKKVYEYERQVGKGINHCTINEITDDKTRQSDFPQVALALKLLDEGII